MSELTFLILSIGLLLAIALLLIHFCRGPSAPDRVLGISFISVISMCFPVLLALKTGENFYLNIAIAWILFGFIGSIALAKYLEGKGLDE